MKLVYYFLTVIVMNAIHAETLACSSLGLSGECSEAISKGDVFREGVPGAVFRQRY